MYVCSWALAGSAAFSTYWPLTLTRNSSGMQASEAMPLEAWQFGVQEHGRLSVHPKLDVLVGRPTLGQPVPLFLAQRSMQDVSKFLLLPGEEVNFPCVEDVMFKQVLYTEPIFTQGPICHFTSLQDSSHRAFVEQRPELWVLVLLILVLSSQIQYFRILFDQVGLSTHDASSS